MHLLCARIFFLLAVFISLSAAPSFAATVSYSQTFATGWNLAGNSLTTPIDVHATFSSQTNIQTIWKWDAAASRWAFYAPSLDSAGALTSYATSKGYSVLSIINPGEGFWVNALAPVSLGTVNGTGFSLTTSNLVTGWNLVATGDNITPASFTSNIGNVATLWAWDNANSAWYFYAPSLAASNTLSNYTQSKNYESFGALNLGNGLGFWVNYAVAPLPVYPINAPITTFNATSLSVTMTGTYLGNNLVYSVSNTQGATNQTFLGQSASVSNSNGYITENGIARSSFSSAYYFSVNPYKSLGSISAGQYTVYANQADLPTIATIGMSGNLDTGIDYSDSTQSTILDTFVETWSLMTGPTSGTAYLCVNTVYTAIASSATSETSTACLNIDTSGNILGVQVTGPINGTIVTLSSTNLITIPGAPTITNVTAGAGSATVSFIAPYNNGGAAITGYTVTAIPSTSTLLGNVTATGATSPILITNLTAGTAYTFTVAATNSMGTGYASAESVSIIPTVGAGFYVVSTLAGSGTAGNTNSTGITASFNGPSGIAVDSTGNVYVTDSYNNLIRKISPAGVVSTLAGSGNAGNINSTGTAASFNGPSGIAVDSNGNVYVADTYNNEIRMITPSGMVSTLAGSGNTGSANGTGATASFYRPTGVAVDSIGNVYVADTDNNEIRKITPVGVVSTLAGTPFSQGGADGPVSSATFNLPSGIALDSSGNIYVSDSNRIRVITPTGIVRTLAGGYGTSTFYEFSYLGGVAVDGNGNVYVADPGTNLIQTITQAGIVSTLAGEVYATLPKAGTRGNKNGLSTVSSFNAPHGVAVDSSGNVYVADAFNNEIRKITLVH